MISNDIINKISSHSFVTSLFLSVSSWLPLIKTWNCQFDNIFSVISTPDGKKKAKCNMYKVEVSYSGGSTGTMPNHLKHVRKSLRLSQWWKTPNCAKADHRLSWLGPFCLHWGILILCIWPFWLTSTVHNIYVWDDPSNFAAIRKQFCQYTNLAVWSKVIVN